MTARERSRKDVTGALVLQDKLKIGSAPANRVLDALDSEFVASGASPSSSDTEA
ncbi:hypothetical protein [Paraburkholderia ultramafica]|uniref:hypothetical protein n=1 Tax=Paraburkholderia ultramafica TaxID=1544867 RepID=UPI001582BDE0|nr:hypothetical protein [Paraburkholderia ultramafica]